MIHYKEMLEHYKSDPILHGAIEDLGIEIKPELDLDIYLALLNSIVSQQLSTKVARIIWRRFTDLFVQGYPDPQKLLEMEHEVLRKAGLSNSKANYMKNVAEFKLEEEMGFEYLNQLSDNEVIEHLSRIKGVGTWTVQMILMFPMDRPDVFPVDDLGIQKGMKSLYNIDLEKKELKNKLLEISSQWQPYRTLASKYIWELSDNKGG